MLRIYVSHTWMEEGQCVDFPLMNRGWKHTRCQVPRTQSATDHTRRHPPARYPQNPQIPARDDSFILPRCSRPGLCLPERSTDNLFCLLRGERMWESLKCFFFFLTLKPTERGAGGEEEAGVGRGVTKMPAQPRGTWRSAEMWSWEGEIRTTARRPEFKTHPYRIRGLDLETVSDKWTLTAQSPLTFVFNIKFLSLHHLTDDLLTHTGCFQTCTGVRTSPWASPDYYVSAFILLLWPPAAFVIRERKRRSMSEKAIRSVAGW